MIEAEVLTQIIDLLKRQGRVSYGALKRRFDLDDDYLKDLKDEILYVHPVREDEGRGLIWTGDTESVQEGAFRLAQTPQPPAPQKQHSPQTTPLPTAPPPPDAERRQLTVMFCDLVDSTTLSSQLDPEEYREVVRAYQKVCSEVITRFEGHIAQLLGDGLLVYFGYPQAHEDDAQRSIRVGIGILSAMGDLNRGLQQAKGIQLGVRLGIHTGLVVVGEMGGAGRQEQLALGEVPNIASRIEGMAAPNPLAMSEATSRLVEGYFICESLGEQTLRGVFQPLKVYQVLSESGVHNRLDIVSGHGLTPLVGREQEIGLLLQQSSDNSTEAESCFQHAISIAQNQQAKSWELRAATSLARLWHQQGKRQEAHDLLAPVYNWFTEGFDTADLKDAKALLEELA